MSQRFSRPRPGNRSAPLVMRVFRAALALSLCGGTPLVAQARGTVALMNANVLPMDREGDTLLAGQTVLIRDGIIQQVGPSTRVRIPAGTTRIEARGKYLMPGLADMHVHQVGPRQLQEELLKMYVVTGVTTILNMRGTPDHLAMRADIERDACLAPTCIRSDDM